MRVPIQGATTNVAVEMSRAIVTFVELKGALEVWQRLWQRLQNCM
jgi:hypothetical protein